MTEFWLVRHGQTNWNLEGRYQGSRDIELNETGIRQAESAAGRLSDKPFEAVYSSPLRRCLRTARMIAAANVSEPEVEVDDRLVEVNLGKWEGVLFTDIQRDYPDELEARRLDPLHARPPGGESALEVAGRMALAVDDIAGRHPEGPVLLVSHGLALASLLCLAQDVPLERVYGMVPENADPVVVQWQPGLRSPEKQVKNG